MTNAINFTTPPNPTVTAAAGPAPVEPKRKADAPKSSSKNEAVADLRLIIEEDKDGAGFIYKTLDRRTGEILQVLPRDSVLKLAGDGYVPGSVVDQRT
jgi:flagellar protein FlaG